VWYVVLHDVVVNVTPPSTSQTSTYQNTAPAAPSNPTGGSAQIANPASVNCINKGGTLEMREEAGGTAGYCHLPGGMVCEEWALFRGTCGTAAPQ